MILDHSKNKQKCPLTYFIKQKLRFCHSLSPKLAFSQFSLYILPQPLLATVILQMYPLLSFAVYPFAGGLLFPIPTPPLSSHHHWFMAILRICIYFKYLYFQKSFWYYKIKWAQLYFANVLGISSVTCLTLLSRIFTCAVLLTTC